MDLGATCEGCFSASLVQFDGAVNRDSDNTAFSPKQPARVVIASPPRRTKQSRFVPRATHKKMGTDTSPAFAAEGYFGGVGRSEVRAEMCLPARRGEYPFSEFW